ncbi:MAG TPA: protein kinase [Anaerolineae bacterium]|nr:protein kinase [Anaerolineae bacterium]
MQSLIGRMVGRFQIVGLLGEGGMGAVLKGRDTTLQRDVAIKVMHPHFARQADFQERFLQEARTAARVNHPGVVQVYDFGKTDSLLYIVMEFIPGDNLRQMLLDLRAEKRWIQLSEAVELLRQMALAVDYAHRQGVLHRDLKPANIMLKAEPSGILPYRPVLTDLGLAKLVDGGRLTVEGTSMGTPAYMSPEQATGSTTDGRSDVYSLGILLFELAVGQLPFPAKTITEAIRYHVNEPPPRPRAMRSELPVELEKIILKAIEKPPANRFADAKSLAEALNKLLASLPQETLTNSTLFHQGQEFESVSLMTRYQESLAAPRGSSILAQFPETPSGLSHDRVTVLMGDDTARTVEMKADGLVIGRGKEFDLVLDDQAVSRQHARIDFNGSYYTITDLDSRNGTYLANTKILPGVPERWSPDQIVRIGQHYLRLERNQAPRSTSTLLEEGGTLLAPIVDYTRTDEAPTTMLPAGANPTVGPGQSFKGDRRRFANLPIWLLPLVLFLCVTVSAGAAYGYNSVTTQRAGQTSTAVAAVDATAATQTAVALGTDTDGDGLSDAQEAELGTDPDQVDTDDDGLTDKEETESTSSPLKADTDSDGLLDGEEKDWGTDPLVIDTDGDTIPDGTEVKGESVTNPTAADTDGDGQYDNVDPAPGNLPTQTPLPTATPPNTPTSTPTPTPNYEATSLAEAALTATAQVILDGTATAEAIAAAQVAAQQAAAAQTAEAATAQAAHAAAQATAQAATAQAAQATAQAAATATAQAAADAANAAATATANAAATATAEADAMATAQAQATATAYWSSIANFTGTWINEDKNTGGMTRLIISQVNENMVSFQGFGACSPSDCDWGVINVPFTPPNVTGTFVFSFKKTQVTVYREGDKLIATTFDDYNEGDGRPDRTSNYVLKRQFPLGPGQIIKPIVPIATLIIAPTNP